MIYWDNITSPDNHWQSRWQSLKMSGLCIIQLMTFVLKTDWFTGPDVNHPSRAEAGVYRQTSNVSRTLEGNKIVDHSDVVGAAPVQLHLHSRLNTLLQWIRQRQLQDPTRNIQVLGFGAPCIRELTVYTLSQCYDSWCSGSFWHQTSSSQGFNYIEQVGLRLQRRRIWTTRTLPSFTKKW